MPPKKKPDPKAKKAHDKAKQDAKKKVRNYTQLWVCAY